MVTPAIFDYIGNTPLIEVSEGVYAKCEFLNPTGSIKDRIALAMIADGERRGLISKESVVVEPTSGNTGIALAAVCAARGYRFIAVMPWGTSKDKVAMIRAYGGETVFTLQEDGFEGMDAKVGEIAEVNDQVFLPSQFDNPINIEAQKKTGEEILAQLPGAPGSFVAGVGTGGTLIGIGKALRARYPSVQVVAIEPTGSPILSASMCGHHRIEGIGEGYGAIVKANKGLIDRVMQVTDEDAIGTAKALASQGLFVGVSSGANVWAAIQIKKEIYKDDKAVVVTVLPDRGERYINAGVWD